VVVRLRSQLSVQQRASAVTTCRKETIAGRTPRKRHRGVVCTIYESCSNAKHEVPDSTNHELGTGRGRRGVPAFTYGSPLCSKEECLSMPRFLLYDFPSSESTTLRCCGERLLVSRLLDSLQDAPMSDTFGSLRIISVVLGLAGDPEIRGRGAEEDWSRRGKWRCMRSHCITLCYVIPYSNHAILY